MIKNYCLVGVVGNITPLPVEKSGKGISLWVKDGRRVFLSVMQSSKKFQQSMVVYLEKNRIQIRLKKEALKL